MADDSVESSPEPVFEANFGYHIGKKRFHSADDFAAWATRNRNAYLWLSDFPGGSPGRDQQWPAVDRLAIQADALKAAIEKGDQAAEQAARGAAAQVIEKYYRKKWPLEADDARTALVTQLAQTDKNGAAAALSYFLKVGGVPSDPAQLAILVRAVVFELGVRDTAENERAALEMLAKQWRDKTEELSATVARGESSVSTWSKKADAASTEYRDTFNSTQDERKQAFAKLLEESQERLTKIEKWYSDELGLHSAVKYWGRKGLIHRWLAVVAAVATASSAFVYFTMILPSQFSLVLEKLKVDANDRNWRIGVAAGLILLGVWLVRILVRLTLSQIHMATDAAHRRVVIHTYLALLKNESQAVTADDRSKVLDVVFRPVSDGVVRDDAMPPSPWELLTRTPKA